MQTLLNVDRFAALLAACSFLFSGACTGSTNAMSNAAKSPTATKIQDCRGVAETNPNWPRPGPGVSYASMTVDNRLRDYRLFVPPGLNMAKPVPLVIMLHGSPIDAQGFENNINFDQEASAGGFIEASPNGCDGYWSYTEGHAKSVDENFIQRVIAQVEANFSIDKSRVYIVGGSAGTWVAYRMACDFADEITAIASIAGTMRLSDACRPSRSVSILEMHGTRDNGHPWNGGGPHQASPVDSVMREWATVDGCSPNPVVTQSGITETSLWKQCTGGAVVRLDKVVGGHHTWFGSDLDPVPGEPNANATILSFLESVPPRT